MYKRPLTLLWILIVLLIGCAPQATIQSGKGAAPIQAKLLEPYNGPKARIAVAKFDAKAAKIPKEVGSGIADMLATALVNTNRFIVLERDILNEVIKEQNLGAAGRVSASSAPAIGHIEGAELLVTGAITEYEPHRFSFGGVALGVITGATSVLIHQNNDRAPLGAIMYTDAVVGADIRVIDTRTSRVLLSASFKADAKDFGGGIIGVVGGGRSTVPLGFGGFQHTGIKMAIRALLDKAVAYIAQNTPRNFFHYTNIVSPAPHLIPVHAVPYGGLLLKTYPPKTEYVFTSADAWKRFLKTYFKNPGSISIPDSLFRTEEVIVVFPKTKQPNADLEIQEAVNRVSFVEVKLVEHDTPPPKLNKGETLPLSYLLASIPKQREPVYFSRRVFKK